MAFYRFQFDSKTLSFPAEICASVPDAGKDIPTLWLLHGANSDCNEWFVQTSLMRYLEKRHLAVVTVSTYNGFNVDMHYGAAYAAFLEQEWLSIVRNIFPCLSVDRNKNYLAGASMGGFGAFRLAVNRPDLFSKVGSFAGSIGMPMIIERYERGIQPGGKDFNWAFGSYEHMVNNQNDVIYMVRRCKEQNVLLPQMYMICGIEDFGYALNTIARDDLRAAGADVKWHEMSGIHSYDCWDSQLEAFLDWLEGKEMKV